MKKIIAIAVIVVMMMSVALADAVDVAEQIFDAIKTEYTYDTSTTTRNTTGVDLVVFVVDDATILIMENGARAYDIYTFSANDFIKASIALMTYYCENSNVRLTLAFGEETIEIGDAATAIAVQAVFIDMLVTGNSNV